MRDKPLILVVDDQPQNIELLEAQLIPSGYEVAMAASGAEALMVAARSPDLILLDIMMPNMSGFEVLRKLRADEKTRLIPVVMITALSETEDKVKALEAGCDDFISKPFDKNELLARVRSLLRIKRLQDKVEELLAYANSIIATLREPFLVLDENLRIISSNQAFFAKFGVPEKDTIGCLLTDVGDGLWNNPGLIKLLKEIIPEKKIVKDYEIKNTFKKIGPRVMCLNARQLRISKETLEVLAAMLIGQGNDLILLSIEDITERRETEDLLEENRKKTELFRKNKTLIESKDAIKKSCIDTIHRLTIVAEFKDEDTGAHIGRVSKYCRLIASELGLSEEDIEQVFYASPMHDIGKIGIPSDILLKPGKLNNEEFALIKTHTLIGEKILADSESDMLVMAGRIALCHHERWDGSGYPRGLKGEEIPIEARIMTLADQYDALRSRRPYKPPFDHNKTCEILMQGDGRSMPCHFDPRVLNAFKNAHLQFDTIFNEQ